MASKIHIARDGKESVKRRLIFDGKQSGVNRRARQTQRILLPRAHDVVLSAMHLLDTKLRDEQFEPLDCFARLPQGSKNAPQGWGRLSALVSIDAVPLPFRQGQDADVCGDDPILLMVGTLECRQLGTSVFVIVLRALGFRLAFKKA
eukprot:1654489-Amphidinium_carterae.6